jgi:hypothetical protein
MFTIAVLEGIKVSSTEYTLEDIYKLGVFPDYARLNGVPLPTINQDFDIKTALLRPYRRFR